MTVRNITTSPDLYLYLAKIRDYVAGLNFIHQSLSVLNVKKIINKTDSIYEMMNVTDYFEDKTLNETEIIDITTENILPYLFSIENTTQEQITHEYTTTVTNYLNSTDNLGETATVYQTTEWISTFYWNEWQPWTHCVFNRSKRNLISNEIYTETVHVSCDLISKWLNQL